MESPAQLVTEIRDRSSLPVGFKVLSERLGGFRAGVVPVLRHVGAEIGVQTSLSPATMEHRSHEVPNEKVIEHTVLDRRHQRLTRQLEAQPSPESMGGETDRMVAAADSNVHKIEERAQVCDGSEISLDLFKVAGGKRRGPVIPKYLRRQRGG